MQIFIDIIDNNFININNDSGATPRSKIFFDNGMNFPSS